MGTENTETDDKEQRLQQAQSEKNSQENKRWQKQNQVSTNEEKIRRLKVVKTNLENEKSNAKRNRENLKKYPEGTENLGDWYGVMHSTIKSVLENDVIAQYDGYVDRIDEALDSVCDEITRLQNENMQLEWDILHIGSLINSLINEIATLCN